ncbi:MAG: hypothetical protein ACREFD_04345 [Stellaceae bacterium]
MIYAYVYADEPLEKIAEDWHFGPGGEPRTCGVRLDRGPLGFVVIAVFTKMKK